MRLLGFVLVLSAMITLSWRQVIGQAIDTTNNSMCFMQTALGQVVVTLIFNQQVTSSARYQCAPYDSQALSRQEQQFHGTGYTILESTVVVPNYPEYQLLTPGDVCLNVADIADRDPKSTWHAQWLGQIQPGTEAATEIIVANMFVLAITGPDTQCIHQPDDETVNQLIQTALQQGGVRIVTLGWTP